MMIEDENTSSISQLRALLSQEPSKGAFEEILAYFNAWEDGQERTVAMGYAREHLASWPDDICACTLDVIWPSFPAGEPLSSFAHSAYLPGLEELCLTDNEVPLDMHGRLSSLPRLKALKVCLL